MLQLKILVKHRENIERKINATRKNYLLEQPFCRTIFLAFFRGGCGVAGGGRVLVSESLILRSVLRLKYLLITSKPIKFRF